MHFVSNYAYVQMDFAEKKQTKQKHITLSLVYTRHVCTSAKVCMEKITSSQ